ncbi:hypothetical protein BJY21_003716 [Kineosphaera limosa]|uniref:Bacteriocin biosynthesis cyclodehydratase domain-containing protein n=1 Tax=Kineosphaera limosa NBRC 100340 TaxID=1184609 RepID=K6WYI7_9MICO|nr:hypothetical protein [Kineosphaera limosa]NYE02532.1 hypothetical protein [Kineosphaera limosa]GAB97167.1 hypothetical protein KILIM_058_00190 [Kineosphaera limosa NBRC 100340]
MLDRLPSDTPTYPATGSPAGASTASTASTGPTGAARAPSPTPAAPSRHRLHRPVLQAHARVLRRGPDALQIGSLDAGVVVRGLSEDEIEQLRRLGSRRHGGPRANLGDSPELLVDSTRLTEVLTRLAEHHLLLGATTRMDDLRGIQPEQVWCFAADAAARACAYGLDDDGFTLLSRRTQARVIVDGRGRLVDQITDCLREGGLCAVESGPAAVGAADLALRRRLGQPPDLVVIVAEGAVPHQSAESWRRHGVPHLPVVIDGPVLRVGPLVLDSSPCLECVDRHRGDRDPAWPELLSQLAPNRPGQAQPVEAESSLRALATGLVATFVFGAIDGHPPPPGLSATYRLPSPQATHHAWRSHAACRGCADRRQWNGD